jgi:hypothetical protein
MICLIYGELIEDTDTCLCVDPTDPDPYDTANDFAADR